MSYETLSNTLRDIDRERKKELDKQENSISKRKIQKTPKLVSKSNQKKNKSLLERIIPKIIQTKQILKSDRVTIRIPEPKAPEKLRNPYFSQEYEKEKRKLFFR